MSLYEQFFYSDFTNNLCSDEVMVDLMIEVELALIKAQEDQKIIPPDTFDTLSNIFKKAQVDIDQLKKSIPLTGNAAAPLVKQLVAITSQENEDAAGYIHLGTTSQDIVDTATILKVKRFFNWMIKKIDELDKAIVILARKHRSTVMIGRTIMQQARPITFGLKAASWVQNVRFVKKELEFLKDHLLTCQLGGAVGSENQYISQKVRIKFAKVLQLSNAPSWHTQRGKIASFTSALGVLVGSLAKIANDVVLLSQTEIGEVFEPSASGRGASSTMPHKRNPVLSTSILANAQRVPFLVGTMISAISHDHERSAGKWHAEWETVDDIMALTAGALERGIELVQGLEIREERMRQNLEHTNGLIYAEAVSLALAKKMGKQEAHQLIKLACQKCISTQVSLQKVLIDMNLALNPEELNYLFEAKNAIGFSLEKVDEILATE